MKGKVKCTCGWSWNKSDSSVKDMYICHECGRDNSNNMKNGGWLDNYNDSQASAPEGMVGDGYSNVGRNFSPAWGGQFQNGGKATRADSLAVYNNAKKVEDYYKSKNYKLEKQDAFVSNNDPSRLKKILSDDESRFTNKQYNEISTGYDNIVYFPSKRKLIKNNKESFIDASNPKNKEILKKIYNKKIDDNKLIQREGANRILNLDSPSQYFDLRIQPQSMSSYKDVSKNTLTSNDKVDIIKYDPLAVKPFDLLTDAEKKLRVEKYGISGVPKSYLNKNKPTTTKETTKPSNTEWLPLTKDIAKGRYEGDLKNMVYRKRADGSYDITYQAPPEVSRKPIQPLIKLSPEGLAESDFNIEASLPVIRPEARIPKYYDVEDYTQGSANYLTNQTNYRTSDLSTLSEQSPNNTRKITPRYQMGGSVYPVNYVPQAQNGKLTFLQPTSDKLPEGYMKGSSIPSTERAMSIGGENGEPAYLIPSFKYGQELLGPVFDPISEFKRTGEHLGGPFKTWQEAEEWEETVRHPAVENRETIMFPQEKFAMGGSIPGSVGFTYARTKGIPSEGPYAKKTLPSAQNGQEMRYYQNGLDWKPKGMKDGGWLDGYEKAQFGKTLTPKQLELKKQVERNDRKIETQNKYNEYQENKRKAADLENKKAQAKSNVQANMEKAYEHPLMSPGYFTPEGVAIGALQGATKVGPDLYEGNYKGAAMDALMALPIGIPAAKKLLPRFTPKQNYTLPEPPLELNLNVNEPRLNLQRTSPKIKKVLPDYGKVDIGNDLTLYNNPSRVIDESSILGKKQAIKSVRDNSSGKSIELKTFTDDNGNLKYYMSADMPNRIKAGRAFLELDKHIPIEAEIQEPGSLSFDSLLNVAKQSQSPKFASSVEGTVQLNDAAVFNKIKNKGDSALGNEYYSSLENANKGVEEVNTLLKKYNLPNAEAKQVVRNDGSLSNTYSIHVPSVTLKKLYSILGISTIGAASQMQDEESIPGMKQGGIIKDDRGQWEHPGEVTEINSPYITMQGVPYDVLGISDTGDTKLMKPGKDYKFKGKKVTEFPMAKNGRRQEQKGLVNLDNLLNFTNYNTKQPGGWLDQY